MVYKHSAEFGLINKQTGEIFDAELRIKRRGGRFMKFWQGTQFNNKLDDLQGNSVKILIHLMSVAGYNNSIPNATKLSKLINKSRPLISRAYAELAKAGFLVKIDNEYCLSPFLCWKGSDQMYQKMCENLITSNGKRLNEGENRSEQKEDVYKQIVNNLVEE